MSLYKLSRLSGIPHSKLTNNLKHDAQMSVANLELICKALGISMSDFFNESGNIPGCADSPEPLSSDEIKALRELLKKE